MGYSAPQHPTRRPTRPEPLYVNLALGPRGLSPASSSSSSPQPPSWLVGTPPSSLPRSHGLGDLRGSHREETGAPALDRQCSLAPALLPTAEKQEKVTIFELLMSSGMTNLKISASNERYLLDSNILITWFS